MVFDAWLEATRLIKTAPARGPGGKRMMAAKSQYEAVKALGDELFGEEFETA